MKLRKMVPILLTALLALGYSLTAYAQDETDDPSFVSVADNPKLPRVLLIGDSISMGYTLRVRHLLEGKANVHRPAANCGPTQKGLDNLDVWLGPDHWDVIHFNFGLHDLKYLDAQGKPVDVSKGKQEAPPALYEEHLRAIVARLRKTGAKLIWASTTPVPKGTTGRIAGDERQYNEIAAKIMKENNIPIDDLWAVTETAVATYQRPAGVHFTPAGYDALAASVVASIDRALGEK